MWRGLCFHYHLELQLYQVKRVSEFYTLQKLITLQIPMIVQVEWGTTSCYWARNCFFVVLKWQKKITDFFSSLFFSSLFSFRLCAKIFISTLIQWWLFKLIVNFQFCIQLTKPTDTVMRSIDRILLYSI